MLVPPFFELTPSLYHVLLKKEREIPKISSIIGRHRTIQQYRPFLIIFCSGSDSNFAVPDEITEENLADAMKKADRILSYRPTTVHRCVIECPLTQREK